MDKIARRAIIQTTSAIDTRLDCVSVLEGSVGCSTVNLRYVADKMILQPRSFNCYLKTVATMKWGSPEEIALAILDDVNNEVVARWLQIVLIQPDSAHMVIVEDRQPKWDNTALLSRLKRY